MRRPLALFLPALLAFALLAAGSLITLSPAAAAPIAGAPTTYCGDPDTDPSMDTGAGTMISCDTTITNTVTAIDPVTGVATGSAVVSVTECTGPANGRLDPADLTCSTDQRILTSLVTAVEQCNGVGYGGGNVLECSVEVINIFAGVTPQAITAATVNQCNGSAPDTSGCDPYPANTTNATITQCNNSSYGGGQEDFNCTAAGTTTASLRVTVTQCNDSNYGGGSWLNCSARLTNTTLGLPTPTPAPSEASAPVRTPAPSGAVAPNAPSAPTPAPPGMPAAVPGPIAGAVPGAAPALTPSGAARIPTSDSGIDLSRGSVPSSSPGLPDTRISSAASMPAPGGAPGLGALLLLLVGLPVAWAIGRSSRA